jgi:hypothetical protein
MNVRTRTIREIDYGTRARYRFSIGTTVLRWEARDGHAAPH